LRNRLIASAAAAEFRLLASSSAWRSSWRSRRPAAGLAARGSHPSVGAWVGGTGPRRAGPRSRRSWWPRPSAGCRRPSAR